MVITQVIPQDESSIPLHGVPHGSQATPTAPPAPPPARRPLPPTKLDELSASFLQGGPQGLGVSFLGHCLTAVPLHPRCCNGVCVFQVVQIIVGVLCILFSLRAAYSPLLVLHAPLCLTVTVSIPHIQVAKLWLVVPPASSLSSAYAQFVVSGSLTLATLKKTSASLVSLYL